MKVITRATEEAVEHRLALHEHFLVDGRISPCEQVLLDSAGEVYKWIETAGGYYRVGMRVLGGGAVDNGLMAQVNNLRELCLEYRANESDPDNRAA